MNTVTSFIHQSLRCSLTQSMDGDWFRPLLRPALALLHMSEWAFIRGISAYAIRSDFF